MIFRRTLGIISVICAMVLMVVALNHVAVSATPKLELSKTTAAPGEKITLYGTGFSGNMVTVTGAYIDPSVQYPVVNSSGSFSCTFTVREGASGIETIFVGDNASGASYSIELRIVSTSLAFSAQGSVGELISVSGSGFPGNSVVSLYWDGATVPFDSINIDQNGVVRSGETFKVPEATRGNHTITASVQGISKTFTVVPKITLDPTSGGVGDKIVVKGTGFAGEASVTITANSLSLDSPTEPAVIMTGRNGSFEAKITIPFLSRGANVIQAMDNGGGVASANFTVVGKITISPTSGKAGTEITLSGNGFVSGKRITSVTLNGSNVQYTPSSVTTDENGAFSGVRFAIPSTASGGSYTIRVTLEDGLYAETRFVLNPEIALGATTVGAGDKVTIVGNGFAPNSSVTFYINGVLVPGSGTNSSSNGLIDTFITVPEMQKGKYTLTAKDASDSSVDVDFFIVQKVSLSPDSGGLFDTVTVTFTGFSANSIIRDVFVVFGSSSSGIEILTDPLPGSIRTNERGSATATFSIPSLRNGAWTFRAVDADGNSASTTLTIASKLTLPITLSENVGFDDPAGVTGSGFLPNRAIVLTYNGVVVPGSGGITTNDSGYFAYVFRLPALKAGTLKYEATDGTNTASLEVTVIPKATSNQNATLLDQGYVGLEMIISGYSFKASSSITIKIGDKSIASNVTTDANGFFAKPVTIPAISAGAHVITVSDGTSVSDIDFYMDSIAPGVATLTLPVQNGKTASKASFAWSAVWDNSGVLYTIQVSTDPNFSSIIFQKSEITTVSYKLSELEKLLATEKGAVYYWRVMATDRAGNAGNWSETGLFSLNTGLPMWAIVTLAVVGGIAAIALLVVLGLWIGRRMAFRSY